ncbi:uncharacterized protein LOC135216432 [Macrobrachium nipponense]|uniref:uncharacterized protein LOC135216432 n=1 Tax=Macrobrachium nipponense TaxID=159736 RepID=UPI0030C82F06
MQEQQKTFVGSRVAQEREDKGIFDNLCREMRLGDGAAFYNYHRVNKEDFDYLLRLVGPKIAKQDTRMRKAIPPEQRLSVTLRHLATGESKTSLGYSYRISPNLLSSVIPEVCEALYAALQPLYMKMPTNEEEWLRIQAEFHSLWQFPNCCGALDGKRVLIAKPSKSGSTYYDYKCYFSSILLALVDAKLRFIYVDVGGAGRASDEGIWEKCSLKRALDRDLVKFLPHKSLPFSQKACPSVILADDAFPLTTTLMKPYPGRGLTHEKRMFNYRLSRARRTSENAFGILSEKFRIFKQPINTSPENINSVILAACSLHNFLRTCSPNTYAPAEMLEPEDHCNGTVQSGVWHQEEHGGMIGLLPIPRRPQNDAAVVRDTFMAYFNGEGRVPWQEQMALFH